MLQTPFLLTQFSTALLDFFLVLCARFMDFILCFQQQFFLPVLTAAEGFVNNAGGFLLCRADFPLTDLFTIDNTDSEEHTGCYNIA